MATKKDVPTPPAVIDAARSLSDFVNRNSGALASKQFAEELCNKTHRTLQQSSFKVMLACIDHWAKHGDTGNYDARNEATVMTCRRIVESFGNDWQYDINLPHI